MPRNSGEESKSPRDWLEFSRNDYEAAICLSQAPRPLVEIICFHCHQSAEKYLKAFLLSQNTAPPRTHDLFVLCEACEEIDPAFHAIEKTALRLTPMATAGRYPIAVPMDEGIMMSCLHHAKEIHDFVESKFAELPEK